MKRYRSIDDVHNQYLIAGHEIHYDYDDNDDAGFMGIDIDSDNILDDDALFNHEPIRNNSSHGSEAEFLAAHSSNVSTATASTSASVPTTNFIDSSKSTLKTLSYRPVNWQEIARHYDIHGMLSTRKSFEEELSEFKTGKMIHLYIKLCFIYRASIIHLVSTYDYSEQSLDSNYLLLKIMCTV